MIFLLTLIVKLQNHSLDGVYVQLESSIIPVVVKLLFKREPENMKKLIVHVFYSLMKNNLLYMGNVLLIFTLYIFEKCKKH